MARARGQRACGVIYNREREGNKSCHKNMHNKRAKKYQRLVALEPKALEPRALELSRL